MGEAIGIVIILMFMTVCIIGVGLIIHDKEFEDK